MNPWVGSIESRFEMILSGVNRERKDNELVLYNGKFGKSLKNEEGGAAIILTKCVHDRKWRRQSCELGAIQHSVQEVSVPSNGYVILVGPGAWKEKDLILRELNLYQNLDAKKKRIYLRTEDKTDIKYSPAIEDDIIAGVPQLIKNGLIDVTWEQEKASKSFVETRHPRTAVAKLKDGKFLMITVDGRSESSGGISLHDLAALLLEFGAVDAMNLDGGGSTTMYLDGKVVNKPSDKEGERKVSDAILVTLRKK